MQWFNTDKRKYRKKRKGEVVKGTIDFLDEDGVKKTKEIRFKKTKYLPEKCSTPRRICIKCLKNTIRKNDLNYESKVCKECTNLQKDNHEI